MESQQAARSPTLSGVGHEPDPSGKFVVDDDFRSHYLQVYIEATLLSIRYSRNLPMKTYGMNPLKFYVVNRDCLAGPMKMTVLIKISSKYSQ
jgi:hypothetical protein